MRHFDDDLAAGFQLAVDRLQDVRLKRDVLQDVEHRHDVEVGGMVGDALPRRDLRRMLGDPAEAILAQLDAAGLCRHVGGQFQETAVAAAEIADDLPDVGFEQREPAAGIVERRRIHERARRDRDQRPVAVTVCRLFLLVVGVGPLDPPEEDYLRSAIAVTWSRRSRVRGAISSTLRRSINPRSMNS